jgi:hypothetical protein
MPGARRPRGSFVPQDHKPRHYATVIV